MKLRTWNVPLVTFLSGCNTVLLNGDEEIQAFIQMMSMLGIDASVLKKAGHQPGLLVEFNNGKGTTWWNGTPHYPTIGSAIQASTDWYGIAPFTWDDIKII